MLFSLHFPPSACILHVHPPIQVVIQTVESLTSNAAGGGDRPKDESDDPDKVSW